MTVLVSVAHAAHNSGISGPRSVNRPSVNGKTTPSDPLGDRKTIQTPHPSTGLRAYVRLTFTPEIGVKMGNHMNSLISDGIRSPDYYIDLWHERAKEQRDLSEEQRARAERAEMSLAFWKPFGISMIVVVVLTVALRVFS